MVKLLCFINYGEEDHTVSKEINLKKVISIIKSNLLLILIIAVVFTVVAGVYTKITVVPRYSSVIKFCLRSDIQNSATTGANERNQYMYANEQMATCIETLETGDAYQELNGYLHSKYNMYENKFLTKTNVEIVQKNEFSNIIHVTITTTEAKLSLAACEVFETMASKRVEKVGKLKLERIDSPVEAQEPISSGIVKRCVLAFGLGFVVASLLFILKVALDNTIKDGATVCEDMGILLLSEIPDIYTATEADKIYEAKLRPMK